MGFLQKIESLKEEATANVEVISWLNSGLKKLETGAKEAAEDIEAVKSVTKVGVLMADAINDGLSSARDLTEKEKKEIIKTIKLYLK